MKNWKKLLGLAALLVVMAGTGLYASSDVDWINGQAVPTTFYAEKVFDGNFRFVADAKTASFTFSENDNFYIIDSSGGAITATLPAPSSVDTGKCWYTTLKTAGNAVTLDAGTFSVNGAVTDNTMDAAGDSVIVCNTGAGYIYISNYKH